MFQRIFVPLDGSKQSEQAIPVAARIARASKGTIVFVHMVLPPVEFGTSSAEHPLAFKPGAFRRRKEVALQYLERLALAYTDELSGVNTEMDLTTSAAAPEMYSAASLEKIDLIVLCSDGEEGLKRWVFGSIACEGMRHRPVSVLVLNEASSTSGVKDLSHPLRVLVTLDGSDFSESALLPAAHLTALLSAPVPGEIHLLSVLTLPFLHERIRDRFSLSDVLQEELRQSAQTYLKSVVERCKTAFAGLNLSVSSSMIVHFSAVEGILKALERPLERDQTPGYDMIALATHGRGGLQRQVMGSVAESILGATTLPLLAVRPQKARSSHEEPDGADQREDTRVASESWIGGVHSMLLLEQGLEADCDWRV